jgi:predicted permease
VSIYRTGERTLTGRGEPERVRVTAVTPTVSAVLGTGPVLGRWFTEAEGTGSAEQVAVVSHEMWQRLFAGLPDVLGQALTLDGAPAQIVGVMPPSFSFPDPGIDVWLAERLERSAGFGLPFGYTGVARMGEGSSVEQVRRELDGLIADLPRAYPGDPGVVGNVGQGGLASRVITLKDATVGHVERALWTLFAAVSLVLAIAAANTANLFLVRIESRQREVAVRRALGAGQAGIIGFFLAESTWLALAGVAGGLAMAGGVIGLLVRFGPAHLPRLSEIAIDRASVSFAFVLGAAAALMLAALPLLGRTPLVSGLHEGGRGTAAAGRFRLRYALMGAQVALAMLLLVGAALMARSINSLRTVERGFDPTSALTMRIVLPARDYPTRAAAVAGHHALIDQLARLPGVSGVSAATSLPLRDRCFYNTLVVRGRPFPPGTFGPLVRWCAIAGGFHETMGTALIGGRNVTRSEIERAEASVVVNQALVDVVFSDRPPLGEHLRSNAPPGPDMQKGSDGELTWDGAPPWLAVVGVVANTPARALAERSPVPTVYMPMSLASGPDIPVRAMLGPDVSAMSYVVRLEQSVSGLMGSIRQAVDVVDPRLALAEISTLEDLTDEASGEMTFTTALLALAAGVAMLLGLVGIYGVTSYVVMQRTGEIGVRLALGADPRDVSRLIVRQGGVVALVGIAIGLVLALAGGRLIQSLLFRVSPHDPLMFAVTAALMLCVTLLACWLPARRAARLSPVEALRAD